MRGGAARSFRTVADGVGKRIRDAREALGIKQAELADAIGVRPQSMWRFEHDEMTPSAESAVLIARKLGVSVEWLILGEDPPAVAAVEPPESYREWRRQGPEELDPEVENRMLRSGMRFGPKDVYRWAQLYDLVRADIASRDAVRSKTRRSGRFELPSEPPKAPKRAHRKH